MKPAAVLLPLAILAAVTSLAQAQAATPAEQTREQPPTLMELRQAHDMTTAAIKKLQAEMKMDRGAKGRERNRREREGQLDVRQTAHPEKQRELQRLVDRKAELERKISSLKSAANDTGETVKKADKKP